MRRREFIVALAGAVACSPINTYAQKTSIPAIGYLGSASPEPNRPYTAAFVHGLAEMGLTEDRDFVIDYRWAEGHFERLPALAAELVRDHVAAIFACGGTVSARAAKQVTSSTPIVFSIADDPVRVGLVDSIIRPTANITGATINFTVLGAKRWELLREMAPRTKAVEVLVDPDSPPSVLEAQQIEEAARAVGVQAPILNVRGDGVIETALTTNVQQAARALIVTATANFTRRREEIVASVARRAIPAIYFEREFVTAGGLMSYGASLRDNYRQAGLYIGKLLRGAKPSDLPVAQGTKIEFIINLKTARALGLTVPATLLTSADEVIE
jgi:putative tryptophan/tyrosine transport system substrate-binding protein